MEKKLILLVLAEIVLFFTSGCSIEWSRAIHYGKISQNDFNETVDIEIQQGLLFIPVMINGKNYRFLFDSGAPFSISKELQTQHSFKTVSRGKIIDSDYNRKKVKWIKVDSIQIGNISFINQTAFIGDFKANPVLECLKFDGIIGSNLIRHCNWTIDQELKKVSLSNDVIDTVIKESIRIPFKEDFQYNIFLDIKISEATIKNVLVDYGSNGSIALNDEIFSILKEKDIVDKTLIEKGVKETGIIGEPIKFIDEITFPDVIKINGLKLNNVEVKTGMTDLIGNKILSRFILTIDWDNKNLYLQEIKTPAKFNESFGFRIGYSSETGVYIQSVVENSLAYNKGIRPYMKVTKVDELNFEYGNDFCDYLNHDPGYTVFLELVDSTGQKQEYHVDKETF
jgi:hypothetical protein